MSLIIENNNRHEHNGNGIAIEQNVSNQAREREAITSIKMNAY